MARRSMGSAAKGAAASKRSPTKGAQSKRPPARARKKLRGTGELAGSFPRSRFRNYEGYSARFPILITRSNLCHDRLAAITFPVGYEDSFSDLNVYIGIQDDGSSTPFVFKIEVS